MRLARVCGRARRLVFFVSLRARALRPSPSLSLPTRNARASPTPNINTPRKPRTHNTTHQTLKVKRLTAENRLPHLLLYGPPGTGKTSTILAVARPIYGPALHNMTLELNASDDRGIGVVRQEIQDFASTKSVYANRFKLIILDECDAMTKDAQFALRRGEWVLLRDEEEVVWLGSFARVFFFASLVAGLAPPHTHAHTTHHHPPPTKRK